MVTTALVLVTFLSHEQRMVFAEQAINEKMDTFVEADNKPIESLAALSSGVYSLTLAQGVRPGCGWKSSDQGMYAQCCNLILIVLLLYSLSIFHYYSYKSTCCRVFGIQQQDMHYITVSQVHCWSSDEKTEQIYDVA